mgnify:CR=1 FL=1
MWPPSEDDMLHVASSAARTVLRKKNNTSTEINVLVYWENDPNLLIFDPISGAMADTEYVRRSYRSREGDLHINVIIGRID